MVWGHRFPRSLAWNARYQGRGAAGVWVCTEEVEFIRPLDITLAPRVDFGDDSDIANLQMMTDAVHEHGFGWNRSRFIKGLSGKNYYSRLPTFAPASNASVLGGYPMQARAMSKTRISSISVNGIKMLQLF